MKKQARVQDFGAMLVLLGLSGCGGVNLRAFGGPTLNGRNQVGMQVGFAASAAHVALPVKAERPVHFIMLHMGSGGDIQPRNGLYYMRLWPDISYMNSSLDRINFRATARFSMGGPMGSAVEPWRYGFGGSMAVTATLNTRQLPHANWLWLLGLEGLGDFYVSRGPYAPPWQEFTTGLAMVLELHREPKLILPLLQK
jgi:hypothetical protein